jgi:transcriptional regulator with XRE-family HTH domain
MPGVRRSQLAVDLDRRSVEQRARIGSEIRAMRERRGWTRTELARRAGIGRMVESRVERGATNLDLDVLQRIGAGLGRPLVVTFGRDLLEAPLDAGHLAMQELVLRLGRAAGYTGSFELPSKPGGSWRSIDVGLADAARRRLVLVECWNTIDDVGAAARSSERKRSDLDAVATGRWGPDVATYALWVVRATARNRALIQRYPEVFTARFPASSRAWVDSLTLGTDPPDDPGLVWCDVGGTRLFGWRRT